MAEEDSPISVVSDAAEVETVGDDDDEDGVDNAETTMETTRAQAEARRKRILEKANNRMKYVNGEQVQDEEEKKTSRSNAARIRAARSRRYGKKSAAATASTPTAEPSAAVEASTSTSAPETEPEKVESDVNKEKTLEAPIEATASAEDTTSSATATEPKKKYVGVAKMRRKLLAKKKMEEENTDAGASSTANSESAKAALAADGKASKGNTAASTTSVGKALLPPVKVQTIPIYMHMIVILLLFVAGFDVGIQQFHVDVDVRTKMAVREHGVPFVHRNPWQPLKPITTGKDSKEALQEKLSPSSSRSSTGDLQDEFGEEIDEEYVPPNIDPIFRTDLDEFTKGPGFIKQMARGAISIHRLILWIFYYAPMGFLASILSIPTAVVQSPPGLFLLAVILRQVVGKGVLGAAIPEASGVDGADGTKSKNNIEVLSMAKNFVKNFFTTTFPTLVTLYDVYLHLKSDMYVVLCGVFFGLAWTHLGSDAALSCDADAIVGASEGEL
jgi:hypothetical protein